MSLIKTLLNLLKSEETDSLRARSQEEPISSPDSVPSDVTQDAEANRAWMEGYATYKRGKGLFFEGKEQEALDCFDKAIECGFSDGEIFAFRAMCLQKLTFCFDAIEDYNRAIAIEPEDCNLYFMRSICLWTVGDEQAQIRDLEEAVRLARHNKAYDLGAKKMGWDSAHEIYDFELKQARIESKRAPEFKEDLIRRRLVRVKRRT